LPRELALDADTVMRLSEADASLGRLAGSGRLLPNPHLLVTAYITREAVSSSRIEGTQASVTEVFDAVTGEAKRDDIREDYRSRLRGNWGRALEVVDLLFATPILTVRYV
jgi:Fic family protein